jgi:predicted Zn-dependent protease
VRRVKAPPIAALAVAERALAAAPAGDGALALVRRERSLMLRYARSRPTQTTAVDDLTAEVAVLRDGHVGRASTNAIDGDALAACGRSAAAAAEAAARATGPGAFPGFPAAGAPRGQGGHDAATAALEPEPGGAALEAAFATAGAAGLEAHGIWTAAEEETAVASSAGTVAVDRTTDAFMKVICIAPGGRSGYAAATAVAAGDLDPGGLAERAARKAAVEGEPASLEPGEYPVVLEAHAVGWLVELLGGTAFNGLAHVEGRGALTGRLGTRVAAPCVNLSDSPRFTGTLPRAFDAEGVPKSPLPLIQDGVAHRVVHDTRSGALAGEPSTGHALAPGGSPGGPLPLNLVLIGGGAADEAELCRPIGRGVYVTRLWYANVVRPHEALVTAVTRDGTFLIEEGEVTRPLLDLRLTDSVLRILARAEALTARTALTSDGEFYGRRLAVGTAVPALRAGAARFTGSAARG